MPGRQTGITIWEGGSKWEKPSASVPADLAALTFPKVALRAHAEAVEMSSPCSLYTESCSGHKQGLLQSSGFRGLLEVTNTSFALLTGMPRGLQCVKPVPASPVTLEYLSVHTGTR